MYQQVAPIETDVKTTTVTKQQQTNKKPLYAVNKQPTEDGKQTSLPRPLSLTAIKNPTLPVSVT